MGLFNQGWGCRCDQCEAQADATIGGYRKHATVAKASRDGWRSLSGTRYWFCSKECLVAWWAEKSQYSKYKHMAAGVRRLLRKFENAGE